MGESIYKEKLEKFTFKHWIGSGIIFINDLLSHNGALDTKHIYDKLIIKTIGLLK